VSKLDGVLRRFVAAGSELDPGLPRSLANTGLFADVPNLVPAAGLVEYEPILPAWSNFGMTRRWLALPNGTRSASRRPAPERARRRRARRAVRPAGLGRPRARRDGQGLIRQDFGRRGYTYW
jgi:hypothetical protein